MTQINTFDMVNEIIIPNTLILSDIDETILFYEDINPKWWKEKNEYYMNIYGDNELSQIQCLDDWFKYIQHNKPLHTDKVGFENMLKKIEETNSTLMFVTARNPKFQKITQEHFDHLYIDNLKYEVHYLAGCSKGDFIKDNIDISKYDQVIFIDDLVKNIKSVSDIFENKIKTYQFVLKD